MVAILINHIYLDEHEVAWIRNTTTKVIEVVLDHTAYGLSPAQIHAEHPHLSLGQVHAALSYYFDNKSEIDAEIERRYNTAQALKSQSGKQLTRQELEARRQKTETSA